MRRNAKIAKNALWLWREEAALPLFPPQPATALFQIARVTFSFDLFFLPTCPLSESLALVFISPREHKGCFQNSPPGKSFSPLPPDMRGWKPGKTGQKVSIQNQTMKGVQTGPDSGSERLLEFELIFIVSFYPLAS